VLKLFYAVGTCALASHIALEEAGVEYDALRLEFRTNEQRKPEYLAINPKGRVPALVTDDGVLTETPAILAFVAQRFPSAGLAPTADPFVFACVQPSTATYVPPFMSRTRTACGVTGGLTILPRLKKCGEKRLPRSATVST
jgi:Glutathione S-transferase, N-terminal domain